MYISLSLYIYIYIYIYIDNIHTHDKYPSGRPRGELVDLMRLCPPQQN